MSAPRVGFSAFTRKGVEQYNPLQITEETQESLALVAKEPGAKSFF